jgi:hypothetical protein
MTPPDPQTPPRDLNAAVRRLILARAAEINGKLLARLATVADDLDQGNHLAALGALDGIEREIEQMRSFLLLLR